MSARLLLLATLAACGTSTIEVHQPDGQIDQISCNKGCTAPTPDERSTRPSADTADDIGAWAETAIWKDSVAFDSLLFHADDTVAWLAEHGSGPLDAAHRTKLDAELARDQVAVAFRLIDDHGAVLGRTAVTVPLKEKQHLALAGTGDLGHISINGKVKRVGPEHLWARF